MPMGPEERQEKGRTYVMNMKKLLERPTIGGNVILKVHESYTSHHRCLCQGTTFDMSVDEESMRDDATKNVGLYYMFCTDLSDQKNVRGRFKEFLNIVYKVIKPECEAHEDKVNFVFISTYSPILECGERELKDFSYLGSLLKKLKIVDDLDDDEVKKNVSLMNVRVHVIVVPSGFLKKLVGG